MEQSPRLSLSYVAPAQAQKHVTVNETFRRLDALVQMTVKSRTVAVEPPSPAEGDGYILPASPSGGAWDNFAADNLAFYQDGAWVSVMGVQGMRAYVVDEGDMVAFDGAAWSPIALGEEADRFGVNTSADATNRLSVKSDAVLFSHDDITPGSGDAQVKVNKAAAGDTASHLFQTGFSGRAEFGLTGDDDFHVKVSADGSAWRDALIVDKDNGFVGIGGYAPERPLDVRGDQVELFQLVGHEDVAGGVGVNFSKGRGTNESKSAVQANDTIGVIRGKAWDGAAYQTVVNLRQKAEGVSGSSIGSRFEFFVRDDAGTGNTVMIVSGNTGIEFDLPAKLKSYAVASLPSAATFGAGAMIYVSDESGGAIPAFSDGTNWRRVTDRVVVS